MRLTERNIEEIEPGEAVLSFTVDGRPTVRKVLKQLVHQSSKGYLQITLANGTVLKVTEEHPFLTKPAEKALKDNGRFSGYYTPAGKLRPGDTLYQTTPGRPLGRFPAELEPVKIVQMEKKAYRGRVYNLNIAETHTYFADGVAVHNEKSNQNQNNDSGDNGESACVDGKPCSNNSDCPGGHCAWDPIQPNCACGGGAGGGRTYHYTFFPRQQQNMTIAHERSQCPSEN